MAYDNNRGGDSFQQRQWFQGDWTCAKCGAKIDRLPFEPDPSRLDQLKCRDCHRQAKQNFRANRY